LRVSRSVALILNGNNVECRTQNAKRVTLLSSRHYNYGVCQFIVPSLLTRVPQHPEKAQEEACHRKRVAYQMAQGGLLSREFVTVHTNDVYAEYPHTGRLSVRSCEQNEIHYNQEHRQSQHDEQISIRTHHRLMAHGRKAKREEHHRYESNQKVEHPCPIAQAEARLLEGAYEGVGWRSVASTDYADWRCSGSRMSEPRGAVRAWARDPCLAKFRRRRRIERGAPTLWRGRRGYGGSSSVERTADGPLPSGRSLATVRAKSGPVAQLFPAVWAKSSVLDLF